MVLGNPTRGEGRRFVTRKNLGLRVGMHIGRVHPFQLRPKVQVP